MCCRRGGYVSRADGRHGVRVRSSESSTGGCLGLLLLFALQPALLIVLPVVVLFLVLLMLLLVLELLLVLRPSLLLWLLLLPLLLALLGLLYTAAVDAAATAAATAAGNLATGATFLPFFCFCFGTPALFDPHATTCSTHNC